MPFLDGVNPSLIDLSMEFGEYIDGKFYSHGLAEGENPPYRYWIGIDYVFDVPSKITVDVTKGETVKNIPNFSVNLPDDLNYRLESVSLEKSQIYIYHKTAENNQAVVCIQDISTEYICNWDTFNLPEKISLGYTELEFLRTYYNGAYPEMTKGMDEIYKTLPQIQNYKFGFDFEYFEYENMFAMPLEESGKCMFVITIRSDDDYRIRLEKVIPVEFENSSYRNSTDQAIANKIKEQIKNTKFDIYFSENENDSASINNQIREKINIDSDKINVFVEEYDSDGKLYISVFVDNIYYGLASANFTKKSENESSGNESSSSSNNTNKNLISTIDAKTNIKLEADYDAVPSNTVIEVTEIAMGDTYNTVRAVLTDVTNFKVYDITLKSNGVSIQPNGKVKISIPIPSNFDITKLAVYRVSTIGEKTGYNVTIEIIENKKYATFETEHFSTYVLAESTSITNNENSQSDNTDKEHRLDNEPKTGVMITKVGITLIIAVLGFIISKKRIYK